MDKGSMMRKDRNREREARISSRPGQQRCVLSSWQKQLYKQQASFPSYFRPEFPPPALRSAIMSLAAARQAATFLSGALWIAVTVAVWMPMAPSRLESKSKALFNSSKGWSSEERGLQPLSFSTIAFLAALSTSADARPDGKEMGYRDRMAWIRGGGGGDNGRADRAEAGRMAWGAGRCGDDDA